MIEVITNTVPFAGSLEQLQRRMKDLTPLMRSIGVKLEGRIAGRFETQTDPDGAGWAAWAASTVATYPEDGRRKLLQRYGDMIDSLNSKPDASSVRVGFGAVAGRNRDAYQTYHEYGSDRMPRRGLLFSDPDQGTLGAGDEQAINELLQDWLDGLFD